MADGVFSQLTEGLQKILDEKNWTPTPVQNASQEIISSGKDSLVIAPTGSGKTMAAMLPLLDRAICSGWEGMSILYITPLRALNRDVDRRLDEIVNSVGLTLGLRHGDTSQWREQSRLENLQM